MIGKAEIAQLQLQRKQEREMINRAVKHYRRTKKRWTKTDEATYRRVVR